MSRALSSEPTSVPHLGGGPPRAYRGVDNLVKPFTDWRPPRHSSLRRLSPRRGLPSEEASNH
eukprot:1242103-Alexandrium_andersonii.AAC.1